MDESRIGQYRISVTTYPIMALILHIYDCKHKNLTLKPNF